MTLRSRFWLLTSLRWLPTGLVVPSATLLPLDRGLTVAQVGSLVAFQATAVVLLELPTGALSDTWGRRPVLVGSTVVACAGYLATATAQGYAGFAVASTLMGVFRALDSGPLNAWYVSAVHDEACDAGTSDAERGRTVSGGLSGAGSVLAGSIAVGALLAGGLIAWAPTGRGAALVVPYVVAAATTLVGLVACLALVVEPDRPGRVGLAAIVAQVPRAVRDGVGLVAGSRVLVALVGIELLWGFGLIAYETLTPIRLAELLGGRGEAGAVMGPVVAGGWAMASVGAAACVPVLRRWGAVRVSVVLKLVQCATVVAMGLAAGPVGLVAGYLATYATHVAASAAYESLLHDEVDNQHRGTVLSVVSMAMHPAAAMGGIVLGAVATGASTGTAMIVGALVLAVAAPLFLVRRR